jgi:hypothetical protein
MPDTNNIANERREYYRFDETLIMNYSIITADNKLGNKEQFANQQAKALINEFSSMTQQIKMSLSRMNNRSPELSSCFKILDTKINLLAQTILYQDKENSLMHHKANISAGGISFAVEQNIPANTELMLQLVLPPELNILNVKAKVIKCNVNKNDDFAYRLSTQFIETNDITEDIIVRHIMHRQSDQLRAKKEQ